MGFLSLLTRSSGRSLFLPAHGRGAALPRQLRSLLRRRAGIWDLPEIPEFGGPLMKTGAVALSQNELAVAIGAEHGWYGVNGATGLLQAAVLAIAKPGQYLLMPRNVHRSLIQACLLGDITPVLFDLPFQPDRGHVFPPNGVWIDKVLQSTLLKNIELAAAVLVNPTYHGYARELKYLINSLHDFGCPVLVDESHGTHFASKVDSMLPSSGIGAGADLVVHSLHKSAAGLAQTAVLWSQGSRVDPSVIRRSIGLLQTSSPSALLLASCEAALSDWFTPIGRERLIARLDDARDIALRLRNAGVPLLETQDPLRLIWHTASEGITGFEADSWFIAKGLVGELPEPGCLTFCVGLARQRGLVGSFLKTRRDFLDTYKVRIPFPPFDRPPLPLLTVPAMSCRGAWLSDSKTVDLSESVGCVAAELICPYPPGIPIVFPGERLDYERVAWLIKERNLWPQQIPKSIQVVI